MYRLWAGTKLMAVVDNGSTVYSYKLENENDWEKKSKGTKCAIKKEVTFEEMRKMNNEKC